MAEKLSDEKWNHQIWRTTKQLRYLSEFSPAPSLQGASSHLRPHLLYWLHSPAVWKPASLPSWSWGYPKHLEHTQTHSCPLSTKSKSVKLCCALVTLAQWWLLYLRFCAGLQLVAAAVETAGCPGGSGGPPTHHCCSKIFGQCRTEAWTPWDEKRYCGYFLQNLNIILKEQ